MKWAGTEERRGDVGGMPAVWQQRRRSGVLFGGFMFLQFLFHSHSLKVWKRQSLRKNTWTDSIAVSKMKIFKESGDILSLSGTSSHTLQNANAKC